MNKMLDYLGKKTFTIRYEGNYKETYLTYHRENSVMTKKITEWDHCGKVIAQGEKEKSMGGVNGQRIFRVLKETVKDKAKKQVLEKFLEQELEDNEIYL